jgi:2-dehydro-3-deoxyphosphogluconate aldolase/(4S)-4-hydroxy-2-oxoglutarate aldolase
MPPAGTAGKNFATVKPAASTCITVGGSWLAPEAEIRAGNFAAITERARRTLAALQ